MSVLPRATLLALRQATPQGLHSWRGAEPFHCPPGAAFAIHGRIAHVEGARFLIEDATGAAWLLGEGDVQAGDVVSVIARWDGARLIVDAVERLARPTRPLSRDADHTWLRADDGRRAAFLQHRAAILDLLRTTMRERGLIEIEAPLIVSSPGLDVHLDAINAADGFLITSPEYQMKRLLSAGLGHIYSLGKCFRKGEVGSRHQPEFTMLEWYRSPGSLDDVLSDTEALVHAVTGDEGAFVCPDGRRVITAPPFERLSVAEAFTRYAGIDVFDVLPDEERFFRIVVDQIEPNLGKERPVFLTRWPASMASLARLCDDDPRFAERAELFIDGMELCNAFGELTDPVEQRQRLERDQATRREQGLPVYPIDERFLAALEDGIPPSGGNALGVDRLVMLACGTRQIDDVVAFSHARL